MLSWILIIAVASFVIGLLLNIFFTYLPVSRIEKAVDNAVTNLTAVGTKVDTAADKVNDVVDTIEKGITVVEDIVKFCEQFPTICKAKLAGII